VILVQEMLSKDPLSVMIKCQMIGLAGNITSKTLCSFSRIPHPTPKIYEVNFANLKIIKLRIEVANGRLCMENTGKVGTEQYRYHQVGWPYTGGRYCAGVQKVKGYGNMDICISPTYPSAGRAGGEDKSDRMVTCETLISVQCLQMPVDFTRRYACAGVMTSFRYY